MSSQSTLQDWIGLMVWFFPRNERGLRTHYAEAAIVIDVAREDGILSILIAGEEVPKMVWVNDLEKMEIRDV